LTLLLELSILGLWIPPVYYIASAIARSPDESVPKSTVAALAIFALNMYVAMPRYVDHPADSTSQGLSVA